MNTMNMTFEIGSTSAIESTTAPERVRCHPFLTPSGRLLITGVIVCFCVTVATVVGCGEKEGAQEAIDTVSPASSGEKIAPLVASTEAHAQVSTEVAAAPTAPAEAPDSQGKGAERARTPTTQPLSEHGSNSPPVLYPIIRNGKWGYIDQSGRIVIRPQFDTARGFSHGLAAVEAGWFIKKWGYVDTTGKYVIKRTFDEVGDFIGEFARANVDGKWGYIDKSGKVAIEPRFGNAHDFSEGLAAVEIGGRWGYIDEAGSVVVEPRFAWATTLIEGRGRVNVGGAPAYEAIVGPCVVGGKWGYIDKKGQLVIEPRFDAAGPYAEGLNCVQIGEKWGYIGEKGQLVIEPRFDAAGSFAEGLGCVRIGEKWGYIGKKGELVIKPRFDEARFFAEGLGCVRIGEKWGYIDKSGNVVIEPTFDDAWPFSNGLALVEHGGKTTYRVYNDPVLGVFRETIWGPRGYINKAGEYVWQPTK